MLILCLIHPKKNKNNCFCIMYTYLVCPAFLHQTNAPTLYTCNTQTSFALSHTLLMRAQKSVYASVEVRISERQSPYMVGLQTSLYRAIQ